MRLFVAVDPPADAVAHLRDRLAGLAEELAALRPVAPEQWHLTLAFLGEVAEERVDELSERLARAAGRTAPVRLTLRGGGTFPRRADRARVLWVGVEGQRAELVRLAERAAAAARRTGIAIEDRPYSPHLTIGRPRGRDAADMTAAATALASYDGPEWTADSVRLVRSQLGVVVRHETVAAWPLRAAAETP